MCVCPRCRRLHARLYGVGTQKVQSIWTKAILVSRQRTYTAHKHLSLSRAPKCYLVSCMREPALTNSQGNIATIN